jgi:hypothetical protein
MYIPDWAFVKKLKAYDDKLSVKWLAKAERWGIYREVSSRANLYGKDLLIFIVENQDKSFRELDQRTLDILIKGDTQTRGADIVLDEIMKSQDEIREGQERDARNRDEAMIRDTLPAGGYESDIGAVNVPKEDLIPEDQKEFF